MSKIKDIRIPDRGIMEISQAPEKLVFVNNTGLKVDLIFYEEHGIAELKKAEDGHE